MKAGIFLTSTELLDDSIFEKAVVFITEYNDKGAVGFMINKPFSRNFNELEEFRHSPALPMYEGGPVDQEHLYFIHRRPDLIQGGTPVANGIFWGGDFKETVRLINNNTLTEKDIRLFIGYCGWNTGELDAEVEEGSWKLSETGDLL
ncbi:MAG: YqgE/AlgH family protein [Candidatus Pseudobacter hemicellulosilyticus]|uniref:YqgE/AlgH family protein n=1 Tax=Candidatus Pseudobacter hemicellulosilyticus TaxID=3121375 RepID=A0AAJ6BGU6_9BACT|nr:MAG: YqgE/AlgH family protein [Pseudobacter sp.]